MIDNVDVRSRLRTSSSPFIVRDRQTIGGRTLSHARQGRLGRRAHLLRRLVGLETGTSGSPSTGTHHSTAFAGQHNDARMCISLVMSAIRHGCHATNHAMVADLVKNDEGVVCGAIVVDRISGKKWLTRESWRMNLRGSIEKESWRRKH